MPRTVSRKLSICVGMILLCAGQCLCQTAIEMAVSDGVAKSIAELPKEADVKRVAILPLTGDEAARITDRMITAVVEREIYQVIDRRQLKLLFEEASFQMTDVVNPDTAVQAGKIAGVDAVMYGKVKRLSHGEGWADISFHVRIVKVETGQIFWADDVARAIGAPPKPVIDSERDTASEPMWPYIVALAIIAAVFIAILIWWKHRKRRIITTEVGIEVVRTDGVKNFQSTMEVKEAGDKAESAPTPDVPPADPEVKPLVVATEPGIEVIREDGTKEDQSTTEVKKPQSDDED